MSGVSTPNNSSTPLSLFLNAVKEDDDRTCHSLLSTNPEVLDLAAETWPANPLVLAFNHRSFRVIDLIGRRKPEFAIRKDGDGYSLLHVASYRGDLQRVKALVGVDPQLCLVIDKDSMTALHVAIIKGHGSVIRELVSACPISVRTLTPQNETIFFLALKYFRYDAFEVLLEEVNKVNQEHLLYIEDQNGNNVLHAAVSEELNTIVKLLLSPNSTTGFSMQVNSLNKDGHTALDLHYRNRRGLASQTIGKILDEAGALEACSLGKAQPRLSSPNQRKRTPPWWHLETNRNDFLLTVLALFIVTAFSLTCSLPSFFPKEKHVAKGPFQIKGIVSGELPLVFYIILLITASLTICMGLALVPLCSLPFRSYLLLGLLILYIIYAILAQNQMPKFLVRVGSNYISSSALMWILAVIFIFIAIALIHLPKLARWLKKKLAAHDHRLPSFCHSNQRLPHNN